MSRLQAKKYYPLHYLKISFSPLELQDIKLSATPKLLRKEGANAMSSKQIKWFNVYKKIQKRNRKNK